MPGGFTCCVPGCYRNHKRDKHLSFYVFPKDANLRKSWVKNIGRQGGNGNSEFKPTTAHRVCSEHFDGGKKTYMINVPTVFPLKKQTPSTSKPRRDPIKRHLPPYDAVSHENQFEIVDNAEPEKGNRGPSDSVIDIGDHSYTCVSSATTVDELTSVLKSKNAVISEMSHKTEDLQNELQRLKTENENQKVSIRSLNAENSNQKRKYHTLNLSFEKYKRDISHRIFSVDCIKYKPDILKFYTGFGSYEEYLDLYNFLHPDIEKLNYWGSQTKQNEKTQMHQKLSHHDELLMVLSRLHARLMLDDLANRFGVHRSTVSRICNTYFDLMYRRFRELPLFRAKDQWKKLTRLLQSTLSINEDHA